MTEKTKWAVGRDEVQEKINELTEQRDEFVQQANMQVLSFESQIKVLEDLIAPVPEKLVEDDPPLIETSIETDPEEEESYDPASDPVD